MSGTANKLIKIEEHRQMLLNCFVCQAEFIPAWFLILLYVSAVTERLEVSEKGGAV